MAARDERVDLVLVFDTEPVDDEPGRSLQRRGWDLTRGTPRWRLIVTVASVATVVAMIAPVFVLPIVQARLVTRFIALAVGLLGLQFVVGKAGQLSLCHGVYVGLGSYTTAILVGTYRWPYLLSVSCAPFVGFLGGCLVGLLALRIRAAYLGPVTLSVAVAFPMIVKRFAWLTGGSSGLPILHGVSAPSFVPPEKTYEWLHLVVVGFAVVAFIVARNLVRSSVGLAVDAVATDPLAAASYGINVGRYRVIAAGVGAAFGALGGSLLVLDTPVVGADSYDLFRSLGYYAAVVVGGIGSPVGAVLGSALYTGVPFILSTYGLLVGPNLVFGGLLLSATFVAPAGLTAALGDWLEGFLRIEERPPPEPGRRRSWPRIGAEARMPPRVERAPSRRRPSR